MRIILGLIVCIMMSSLSACKTPNDPDPPPAGDTPRITFSLDGAAAISFECGPNDLVMDDQGTPFITIYDPVAGDNMLYLYASALEKPFAASSTTAYDYCKIWITEPADVYEGTYGTAVVGIDLVSGGTWYKTTTFANTLILDDPVDLGPDGSLVRGTFSGKLQDLVAEDTSISGYFTLTHQTVEIPSGS